MVFMVISKAGKTSIVESNAKVNAKYYCNILSKNMISEMNRLLKQNEYLFMQCNSCNSFKLHHWPPNNPDLNPVDFEIQGLFEQNVYQGQKITDLNSLKDIIEEWDKIPQEIIDKCIDAFKPKLRRVIEVEAWHIGQY